MSNSRVQPCRDEMMSGEPAVQKASDPPRTSEENGFKSLQVVCGLTNMPPEGFSGAETDLQTQALSSIR